MSRQSLLSATDKGDKEMKPGAVHRFPGICLATEENRGDPQLGDGLMKVVRRVIASNGVSYLQMMLLQTNNTSGRINEGRILQY